MFINIIKRVIIPTGNNDNRLVKLQERVLYCIRNTIRVNLPAMICSHIEYPCQYKISSTLPYCGIISTIMLRWNVLAPGPGEEKLEHVNTEKQMADIFTKGLDVVQFENLRTALGLCVSSQWQPTSRCNTPLGAKY